MYWLGGRAIVFIVLHYFSDPGFPLMWAHNKAFVVWVCGCVGVCVCVFQSVTLVAAYVYTQNSHSLVNQYKLVFDIVQLFHFFFEKQTSLLTCLPLIYMGDTKENSTIPWQSQNHHLKYFLFHSFNSPSESSELYRSEVLFCTHPTLNSNTFHRSNFDQRKRRKWSFIVH